jgi:UrcA family protein
MNTVNFGLILCAFTAASCSAEDSLAAEQPSSAMRQSSSIESGGRESDAARSEDISGGALTSSCAGLPSHDSLRNALTFARGQGNGGFGLDMWAAVVNRDGIVCAVAFTGSDRSAQWPGSRVIAAQKANTANAFSLPNLALSTANLWAAVQPGGSLYGLQHSNPVNPNAAYQGPAGAFGLSDDPMVGHRIGGINVFGGGLALYDARKELIGAIGVSGDTSCADHNIAWRARHAMGLDWVPSGVGANHDDNINYQGLVPTIRGSFQRRACLRISRIRSARSQARTKCRKSARRCLRRANKPGHHLRRVGHQCLAFSYFSPRSAIMTLQSQKIFASLISVSLCSASAALASSSRSGQVAESQSVTVVVNDLNVATAAGYAEAVERISVVARRLCNRFRNTARVDDRESAAECMRTAIAEASSQLRQLTANTALRMQR